MHLNIIILLIIIITISRIYDSYIPKGTIINMHGYEYMYRYFYI